MVHKYTVSGTRCPEVVFDLPAKFIKNVERVFGLHHFTSTNAAPYQDQHSRQS